MSAYFEIKLRVQVIRYKRSGRIWASNSNKHVRSFVGQIIHTLLFKINQEYPCLAILHLEIDIFAYVVLRKAKFVYW